MAKKFLPDDTASLPFPFNPEAPWGTANPRRGMSHHNLAVAFVKKFPIGTHLPIYDFDKWVHEVGVLVCPFGAKEDSPEWRSYVQLRNRLWGKLKKASLHSRMTQAGSTPFALARLDSRNLIVNPPEAMLRKTQILESLDSLLTTLTTWDNYRNQSTEWEKLSPKHRDLAKYKLRRARDFQEDIELRIKQEKREIESLYFEIEKETTQAELPFGENLAQSQEEESDIEI